MKSLLQNSIQEPIVFGPIVQSSDHITAATGLTLTVTISKNGGTFASPSGSVSEIGNGWYKLAGNATDTNTLGPLVVHATGTGADPFNEKFEVIAFNHQDGVHLGLTCLPNVASGSAGAIPTTGTGSNQINVSGGVADANIKQTLGSTSQGAAGYVGIDWSKINSANTSQSLANTTIGSVTSLATTIGTAGGGSANTIILGTALGGDNLPNGCSIVITSGTGKNQSRRIVSYTDSTKTATVDRNWVTNPTATSAYAIIWDSGAGLDANGNTNCNVVDVAGSAVNTGAAQLGVNVVNYNGQTASTGADNLPKVSLWGILGSAMSGTASLISAAFSNLFNVSAPTLTCQDVNQTGDSYARIGANGSGLSSVPDTSGTTTLLGRLTSARAGYLDNLNVGGSVASHADIAAINQSASKHLLLVTVGQYEAGESYTIECRTFSASDGSAVNADSTPTITATGAVSGNLGSNLSSISNPSTGVYRVTYTVPSSPTEEQIRIDASATINSMTFTLSAYTQTVMLPTALFTQTDKNNLTAIYNKLPANNIADETIVLAALPAIDGSGRVLLQPSQPSSLDFTSTQKSSLNNATPTANLNYSQVGPTSFVQGTVGAGFYALLLQVGRNGTAQGGTVNTMTLDAGASSVPGSYVGSMISTIGGTGGAPPGQPVDSTHYMQQRTITAYDTSTKIATVDHAWIQSLDSTTQFLMTPYPKSDVYLIGSSDALAAIAGELFVDGSTNKLKVNSDNSVNADGAGGGAGSIYITVPASVAIASQEPGVIGCLRGDTLRVALPLMGDISTRTKLVFTAKISVNDQDDQAVLQVIEGTGLTKLNGSSEVTAATANLTVSDATTGAVNLEIDAAVTAMLAVTDLVWDAQAYLATGIISPISGTLSIVADVTQAVT